MGPEVKTAFFRGRHNQTNQNCVKRVPERAGAIEKAAKWPLRNGLQARRLARWIALVLPSRLLNARHFAEDEAWVGVSTIEHQ